ncbi:MAG TPA: FAD-dependent monooxygenase [Microvirga sp.]|jgi:flavin-dependent dehydrogenase|nr:FAD-dependent monooxygenase [Microvirga sp.]
MTDDVVIVGGGPAGASAACRLARAGRAPLVIERDRAPRHRICGEFLSVEAQAYLRDLGLDPLALGGAPIRRVRLACGRDLVEAALPFEGVGLTRRTLDAALLRQAEAFGARVRRGPVVRAVSGEGSGLRVDLRDGEAIRASTVLLATGKHDLHAPRRPVQRHRNGLVGFKTYLALDPAERARLGDAVEVALFEGGYAGLQAVEGGLVNLCLLVRGDVFARAGRDWPGLLRHFAEASPHLGARLAGARDRLARPLSIAGVPYGFVHRDEGEAPAGLLRLGDQMGVIPSFSGDGIAIAMHSAGVAAATILEGGSAGAYHARMRADIGRPIRLACALSALSAAPLGRGLLLAALRLEPRLLRMLAAWTRIPAPRLRSGRAAGPAPVAASPLDGLAR